MIVGFIVTSTAPETIPAGTVFTSDIQEAIATHLENHFMGKEEVHSLNGFINAVTFGDHDTPPEGYSLKITVPFDLVTGEDGLINTIPMSEVALTLPPKARDILRIKTSSDFVDYRLSKLSAEKSEAYSKVLSTMTTLVEEGRRGEADDLGTAFIALCTQLEAQENTLLDARDALLTILSRTTIQDEQTQQELAGVLGIILEALPKEEG